MPSGRSRKHNSRSRSRSRSPYKKSSDRNKHKKRRKDSPDRDRTPPRRDRKRGSSRDKEKSRSSKYSRDTRSRSNERDRKKSRKESPPDKKEKDVIVIPSKDEPLDKDAEQNRLELEMQKRRERIEQWRKKRDEGKDEGARGSGGTTEPEAPSKAWTLEDEDDDDEDGNDNSTADSSDDVDPLDAYMQSVNEEVKQIKEKDKQVAVTQAPPATTTDGAPVKKVTVITAVAKKPQPAPAPVNKGELMESNADLMEYSSEEEEEGLDDTMTRLAKKKKELTAVDHNKVYYRPFKKDFYIEVPELANMNEEEVTALREELEGIKVRGKKCPAPIKSWAQCGVSKRVLECLKKNGFEKPTPIQAQAIPAIMSGRDLIGIAKTGSGKTLAFLMPMFRHIEDQPPIEEGDGPLAVILTPTRELAMQIGRECKKFTKVLDLNVVCVYGGTGISEQIAELKRGTEIVVCTPGRMIDMLAANNGRVTNLRRCTYIVLDEADRMFDMGFEPQVMRIVDNIRPDRQTVMFSATFPRQMEALARRILNKPVEVQVGGRSVVCKDVEQYVIVMEDHQKFLKLLELLGLYQEMGSILVFVHKQEHADELMKNLLRHAYPCMSLHGGIDQYDRDSIMGDYKSGNIKLLIATSVCARGLDVKDLILVINYDCPNHYEDYVHRVGRTGRAGRHGYSYTFITQDQGRMAGDIIKALELSGTNVPPEVKNLWDEYVKQAELEGRKVTGYSGFKGKGFKFDEQENELANERKKLQKAALGLEDSDDEDAGVDIEEKIEKMFASVKRVTDVSKPVPGAAAPGLGAGLTGVVGGNQQKLELAKELAQKINMARGPGAPDISQQAAAAILKGGSAGPAISSKTLAEQMAEKINARMGYMPRAEKEEEETQNQSQTVETLKRYEEELEINDFPQTARWKVTSRDTIMNICELAEAGITVRGTYIPPPKEPKEGERKLYLGIEATSELAVQKAKAEIVRLIKEELVRLQNSYQPIMKNRYKVT